MTTSIGSFRRRVHPWPLVAALVGLAASAAEAQDAPAEPPAEPVVNAGPGGFSLASAEGDFELRLRFYAQPVFRFFLDEEDARRETFFLHRARFPVTARLFQDLTVFTCIDFAGDRVQLLDAYLDWEWADEIALRLGKVKGPFGSSTRTCPRNSSPTETWGPSSAATSVTGCSSTRRVSSTAWPTGPAPRSTSTTARI
jgi:hypothetical protein